MHDRVPIRRTDSIQEDVKQMELAVAQRAEEIAQGNPEASDPFANWLQAERELVWKPPAELEEQNDEFRIQIALAGVHPKDLRIDVTADELLVRAEQRHQHRENRGDIHLCEFSNGQMFRSLHFPRKIDPNKVTAVLQNGMLLVYARVAQEAPNRALTAKAAAARLRLV